jgi:hypothetical protein
MIRKIVAAACLMLACLAPVSGAQQDSTFRVMTQNMDAGTDLGYALYGLVYGEFLICLEFRGFSVS